MDYQNDNIDNLLVLGTVDGHGNTVDYTSTVTGQSNSRMASQKEFYSLNGCKVTTDWSKYAVFLRICDDLPFYKPIETEWYTDDVIVEPRKYVKIVVRTINQHTLSEEEKADIIAKTKVINTSEMWNNVRNISKNTEENTEKVDKVIYATKGILPNFGSLNIMARLGYRGNDPRFPFEQTHESYKLAYRKGYKIMVADVRMSADGEFVCCHEADLASTYAGVRNLDGSTLSGSVIIADTTLEQLNNYDYGIVRGQQYSQIGITTVKWFLNFCKKMGVIPHLELKATLDSEKMLSLSNLVKIYGLEDAVMFNWDYSNYKDSEKKAYIKTLGDSLPNAVIGYCTKDITEGQIAFATSVNIANRKFLFLSSYNSVNEENALLCANADFAIAYSNVKTDDEMDAIYQSGALSYIKYLSSYVDVNEYLEQKLLN